MYCASFDLSVSLNGKKVFSCVARDYNIREKMREIQAKFPESQGYKYHIVNAC